MAEKINCPACETPNDAWNELCEVCGEELHTEAPVRDDATDGDEFAEPGSDGSPGGFEGVEEVQEYDEDNPDYGVDEDLVARDEEASEEVPDEATAQIDEAIEHGKDGLAEAPDEGHILPEDAADDDASGSARQTGADDEPREATEQFAGHEHKQDDVDGDAPDAPADEDAREEDERPDDEQFDGGAPLDGSPDDTFDDFDTDDVVADGGMAVEADAADYVDGADPVDGIAAESDAAFGEATFDADQEPVEPASSASEAEEEPPPPPELEAILRPEQLDRAPIEPLPTPGPHSEPATLTVLKGDEQLGELTVDSNCTVFGLPDPDETAEQDALETEEAYELEAIEPVEDEADDPEDISYELEPIEEAAPRETDARQEPGEEFGAEAAPADSEVDEEPPAAASFEAPGPLEEGPVIDLSQFGDETHFARRQGYLFRQNKHYTLFVLSATGTQLNDETLEIGEYRELSDGDVIVFGGEVSLRFNEPAA